MAVAIGYLAVLFVVGEPRWMRLVVAIPAGLSAVGFLQARERT